MVESMGGFWAVLLWKYYRKGAGDRAHKVTCRNSLPSRELLGETQFPLSTFLLTGKWSSLTLSQSDGARGAALWVGRGFGPIFHVFIPHSVLEMGRRKGHNQESQPSCPRSLRKAGKRNSLTSQSSSGSYYPSEYEPMTHPLGDKPTWWADYLHGRKMFFGGRECSRSKLLQYKKKITCFCFTFLFLTG